MLSHELKILRSITDSLQPAAQSTGTPEAGIYESLKGKIERECDRVAESLTSAIFSKAKEDVLERYIQYHQTGIIEMADDLQSYLTACGTDSHILAETIRHYLSRLFGLLNYIERFFSRFFNPEEKIPEAYRLLVIREISPGLPGLEAEIDEKIASMALKDCVLDYLHSFTDTNFPAHLTFRGLIYLKGFINELVQAFQQTKVESWDLNVSLMLIYLNFNHLGFLAWYQENLRRELEDAGSSQDHLHMLTNALSQVKSQQTKPSFIYHPSWPNIKTMLENWLSDELSQFNSQAAWEKVGLTAADEKLLLNLSVAQLAFILKLFYDEGCYGNASVTDVIKFTTRHYSSKRQPHISPGSLAKEYYGVDQVTAAVVLDLLQKMTSKINKNFFPVVLVFFTACLLT